MCSRPGNNLFLSLDTSIKYSNFFSSSKKILEQNYVQENESLYISAVHDSILFATSSFCCVFNFFFFLIVKERVYLWFALYVFFGPSGACIGRPFCIPANPVFFGWLEYD